MAATLVAHGVAVGALISHDEISMTQVFPIISSSKPSARRCGGLFLALTFAANGCFATESPFKLPIRPQMQINLGASHLTVEGRLDAPVGRAIAWAVLTDHDGFARFVPGLQVSQVIEDHGNEKVVAQRGEITAGPRLRFDGNVQVTEIPGEGMRLVFLSGLFKDSEGEWQLSGDRPVTLKYRLRMDMRKSPLPPPLASTLAEQQVRQWLSALASEMERRQANRK